MLFLSGLLLVLGSCTGFFNDSGVLKAIHTSEYYTENYKAFVTSVDSMLEKSEIPTSVITDVIQEKQFYISGRAYVSDLLQGIDTSQRTKEIRNNIQNQMDEYFLKKYIQMDDAGEKAKDMMCDQIFASYIKCIEHPFVSEIVNEKQQLKQPVIVVIVVFFLLLGISIALIFWLENHMYRGIMQLVYICLASGSLSLIITYMIERRIEYSDLSPEYYVEFLKTYVNTGINCIRFVSILPFVIAIILYFIAMKMKANAVLQRIKGGA